MKHIFWLAPVVATFILACSDEKENKPEQPVPLSIAFELDEIEVGEGTSKRTIIIPFDKSAVKAGSVTLAVSTKRPEDFIITPSPVNNKITLPFEVGRAFISVDVELADNDVFEGNRSIGFSIFDVSEGIEIGETDTLTITLRDDEAPVFANFEITGGTLHENQHSTTVTVFFTAAALGNGEIHISLEEISAEYITDFNTVPNMDAGRIILPVEAGDDRVSFTILSVNDHFFNGTRSATWFISEAHGSVARGNSIAYEFTMKDDELAGRPKMYQTFADTWQYKRDYFYHEITGRIEQINWDQRTPGQTIGSYEYFYNDQGQLLKIREAAFRDTRYTWADGRITLSESFLNDQRFQYTEYHYDDAGNVSDEVLYQRQGNNDFVMTRNIVYFYYADGNLHRKRVHTRVPNSNDWQVFSLETFESYLDKPNDFPTVEVLPTINVQAKLPESYRVEKNGTNILYHFTYTYNAEGKATSRTASSENGSELTVYEYY